MVLKLYGHPMSTCTRRVAVTCKELGVPYELVTLDFAKQEHKQPGFLEKQPFGQMPYLDDDGFIVFESRAICRYIAAKHGAGKLVPTGVKEAAIFEQGVSIETSNFDPDASGLAWEKMFKKMRGLEADPTRVERLTEQLDGKLNGYEALLSKQKYIGGNELTLADLFHLPYGALLAPGGCNFLEDSAKRPHVARWWKEISSLPSWQAATA